MSKEDRKYYYLLGTTCNLVVFSCYCVPQYWRGLLLSLSSSDEKMSFLRSAHSVAKSLTATESNHPVAISEQWHPISFLDIIDTAAIEFAVSQWN
jgi:hypothetical protein